VISLLIYTAIFQNIHIQYGYDGIDLEIFKFFYDMKDGYFGDIGGFDPVINSTTIYLYGRGWRGFSF
jgi:hypothetical protein